MKITDGKHTARITAINWPLAADLLVRKGVDREYLEKVVEYKDFKRPVQVTNLDDILSEFSVWGIPWQKEYDN